MGLILWLSPFQACPVSLILKLQIPTKAVVTGFSVEFSMVIALLLTGVTHGMLPQENLDLSFSEVLSSSHVFALGKTTLTRGLGSNVQIQYGKILKISPWAYIFPKLFLRGLSMEGNLCFKFDSASLIVRGKFTVFALFSLYLRTIFQVQAPGELIFGGAI